MSGSCDGPRYCSSGTNQPARPYCPVHDQSNSMPSASWLSAAPAIDILLRMASLSAMLSLTVTPDCCSNCCTSSFGSSPHEGSSTVIVWPLMSSLVSIGPVPPDDAAWPPPLLQLVATRATTPTSTAASRAADHLGRGW